MKQQDNSSKIILIEKIVLRFLIDRLTNGDDDDDDPRLDKNSHKVIIIYSVCTVGNIMISLGLLVMI